MSGGSVLGDMSQVHTDRNRMFSLAWLMGTARRTVATEVEG